MAVSIKTGAELETAVEAVCSHILTDGAEGDTPASRQTESDAEASLLALLQSLPNPIEEEEFADRVARWRSESPARSPLETTLIANHVLDLMEPPRD